VAAREVHRRIARLPESLRRAALAWVKPERELAEELNGGSGSRPTTAGQEPGPPALAGIPYLLKDLFDLAGVPTYAGSTFLNQARGTPAKDSIIARRLHELGAACAGKTHLVEFAAGLFGDNAHYGDCPHPHFSDRLAGGSSSGSAALVAAGVVPFALGSDTGGSVRVPAAFCGLHGFRLSPHDAFIGDAVPLSPTFDTVGWFAANATDLLTATHALVGTGKTGKEPRGCYLPAKSFGIPFDPDTAAACDRAAARFARPADAATADALRASWIDAIEAYTVTALGEAHAIHRDWLAPYREHYEPGIWQRFSDGGRYTGNQLAKAAATIATVRKAWAQFFAAYDFLVMPCAPFPALPKANCTPGARRQILTLTTPASLGGLPVLTIPVPLPSGLTAGLQVILPTANSSVVSWILNR
jgi:amidase/aspartyl-tRNA(Asn)/glutamyl-tRNA(Gln) amidotransferase subunit A